MVFMVSPFCERVHLVHLTLALSLLLSSSLPTLIDDTVPSLLLVAVGRYPSAKNQNWNEEMARPRELDLPLFNLTAIIAATDHFSTDNLLGEGGFGPVYKVNQLVSSTDYSLVELEDSVF